MVYWKQIYLILRNSVFLKYTYLLVFLDLEAVNGIPLLLQILCAWLSSPLTSIHKISQQHTKETWLSLFQSMHVNTIFFSCLRKAVERYSLVLCVPLMSDGIGDLTLNLKSPRIWVARLPRPFKAAFNCNAGIALIIGCNEERCIIWW